MLAEEKQRAKDMRNIQEKLDDMFFAPTDEETEEKEVVKGGNSKHKAVTKTQSVLIEEKAVDYVEGELQKIGEFGLRYIFNQYCKRGGTGLD